MECPTCHAEVHAGLTSCPECGTELSNPTVDPQADQPYSDAVPYHEPQMISENEVNTPIADASKPVSGDSASSVASPPGTFATEPTGAVPPSAPARRSGLHTALLLLCAFFLVAGGSLALYHFVLYPAALQSQSAEIAQSQATAQVLAPRQTVAAEKALYAHETNHKPMLSDALQASNANSLFLDAKTADYSCGIVNGSYHLQVNTNPTSALCIANTPIPNNMVYQLETTVVQGDTQVESGLVFNIQTDGQSLIQADYFNITRSGQYRLEWESASNPARILAYGSSSAIQTEPGQTNILTIMSHGNHIDAYVNKQFVTSAIDPTLDTGLIGIQTFNFNSAVDISFKNAQIWRFV